MLNLLKKSKRLKYGSVALIFTVIFIAIVILINAILTALDSKFGLYADITGEQRYDISETTFELIGNIQDNIEIIFCNDRDKLIENDMMSMIVMLSEKYESEFPNISVRYLNIDRNLSEARTLAKATTETKLNRTHVIIRSANTEKARIVMKNSFFTLNFDGRSYYYYGFNGERRFTESILMLANSSDDKVAIITGHGENEDLATLAEVLMGAGYDETEQVKVNLATEDIPENTRLVIINNPQRDFLGYDSANSGNTDEINKLNKYLQNYGNLLVLIDNETGDLPELSEFLAEWGISYISGLVVVDPDNSISPDGKSIRASYNHDSENAAGKYIADKTDLSSSPTIMSSATPLIVDTDKAFSVLKSSANSIVYNGETRIADGEQTLMAISSHFEYDENQNERYTHVIVSGSTDFIHWDMASPSTNNADLVRNILTVAGTESVATDIRVKPFYDVDISGIRTASTRDMTLKLIFIPAGIVMIAGIAVFIRRKRL